jgi:hypothetical protein
MNPAAHIPTMPTESHPVAQPTYPPPMTIRSLRKGVNVAYRQGLAAAGFGLLVLSVPVGIATPAVPVGLPMAVVGGVLLGNNLSWGLRWLDDYLGRHPRIEQQLPDGLIKLVLGRRKRALRD